MENYKGEEKVEKRKNLKREADLIQCMAQKLLTKLIKSGLCYGKKGVAQKIVYGAMEDVATKTGKDAVEVFNQAMENIMPVLKLDSGRIGGANYQVPAEVRPDREKDFRD